MGGLFTGCLLLLGRYKKSMTSDSIGADETDPQLGFISIDSPMAKAPLKKGVDDEVKVQTPDGNLCLYVCAIRY